MSEPRIVPDHAAAAAAIEAFLRAIGQDPASDATLVGTGARVASLYVDELLDGYRVDLDALFSEPIPSPPDAPLVIVQRMPVHVVCPHHLTLGVGHASVAYQPAGLVVGLGAIATLVDAYAHRLALQEDVGRNVANSLVDRLRARGAACVMTMRHGCLEHHGRQKRGAVVATVSLSGSFAVEGGDRTLALAALFASSPGRSGRRGTPAGA